MARKGQVISQEDMIALQLAQQAGETDVTADELERETKQFMESDPFLAALQEGGEVVTAHTAEEFQLGLGPNSEFDFQF